jgi:hypothetical protein
MHIIRETDESGSVWALSPTTLDENTALLKIFTNFSPNSNLIYRGRTEDRTHSGQMVALFEIGGFYEMHTTPNGFGGSIAEQVLIDGQRIQIIGSSPSDRQQLGFMCQSCGVSSRRLILLSGVEINNWISLRVAVELCSVCSSTIIDISQSHWRICDNCLKKCKHRWGTISISVNNKTVITEKYCKYCGDYKHSPRSSENTPLDTALALQRMHPNATLLANGRPIHQLFDRRLDAKQAD